MKKKIVPVLVVLALVAVGGAGYFMGQQSNAPAAETPPAESSTPEVTPDTTPDATPTTPVTEMTSPEPTPTPELNLAPYFQKTYDYVWSRPENYNADYSNTEMEVDALEFFLESDGYALSDEYQKQYIEWRNTNHPTNAYHLNFSGNYKNTVGTDKLYVYASPHTELPPIGEFYKFDVIEHAHKSDDGTWFQAEHNGATIYYRAADLGELTYEEWQYAQELHKEQEDFTEVNETVYASDTVNIREKPSASSAKLGQLKKGNSVTRIGIGQGEFTGWSKVRLSNGAEVYINSSFLTTTKPADKPTASGSGGNGNGGAGGSTPPPSADNTDANNNQTSNSANPGTGTGTGYTDMTNDPDVEVWDFDETNSEDTSDSEHSTGEGTGAGLTIIG